MRKRVVITGLGAVTPLATGSEGSWLALCHGESGIGRITHFDASAFKTQIAAEVKDFHPEDFLNKKTIRRTDLFTHYALAAARMAIDDSRLVINRNNAFRTGVVLGVCLSNMHHSFEMDKWHPPVSFKEWWISGYSDTLLGTCIGGLVTFAKNIAAFLEGGPDSISPFLAPMFIPNMAASEISIAHGIKGHS